MKVNTEWNSGTFSLTHEAEVSDAQLPILAAFGLRYLVQRNRDHDVILGAFTTDKGEAKGEAKGKGPWRRKDWKRNGVAYSTTLAEALKQSYSEVVLSEDEAGAAEKLSVRTHVWQYDGPQGGAKYVREKAKMAEKESSEEGLEVFMKRFADYVGPTHDEAGEDYAPAALAALKVAIDKFLSEKMKGM